MQTKLIDEIFQNMIANEHFGKLKLFSIGERRYLEFQFNKASGFFTALFIAMEKADDDNLEKMRLGFPEEVDALKRWRYGDLAEAADKIGLPV